MLSKEKVAKEQIWRFDQANSEYSFLCKVLEIDELFKSAKVEITKIIKNRRRTPLIDGERHPKIKNMINCDEWKLVKDVCSHCIEKLS
jgi:hypothetical protein